METRKHITAGVVLWTPAPVRTSPASSVISEDVWDHEEEEESEKDDDFLSQMDENGIIGLSPVPVATFQHLLHVTAEEIASAPGIDAETCPVISFTESLPESQGSHITLKSSPSCPEVTLGQRQPAAMFSEEVLSSHSSRVNNRPVKAYDKSDKPTPLPRKMRQRSPEATYPRTRSLSRAKADPLEFKYQTTSPDRELMTPKARRGPLSYPTPDFSKVEPRVHFPKSGYKPPKSRCSSIKVSMSPEPPLVFNSPADIVEQVLLNTADGSPASSDSEKSPSSAPNYTVPQEFSDCEEDASVFDLLQDGYNRLLTKYAEAENTIDRLRLEAKVNLYSDPPKPGHLVQSGLNQDILKFMMLDFPQAQRAEFNSGFLQPNGHRPPQRSSSAAPPTGRPDPQMGQQQLRILYHQVDKFLQQLRTFEDLLKSKKLRPFEQMKNLSLLTEGLASLERGYLVTKDEFKLLQQRGAEINGFDTERELEGLIFQCGLLVDDLKERVDEMQQEQPNSESPRFPPSHPMPSSVLHELGVAETHPQSPAVAVLVEPGETAAVEVSSAPEESDEDEKTLNSLYLKPLNDKQRRVKQVYSTLKDHYQSVEELPQLLDHSQREATPLSSTSRSNIQPVDEQKEGSGHRTGNLEVQEGFLQRKDPSNQNSLIHAGKQRPSRSSSPSRLASSQSITLPVCPPSSRRRSDVGKFHSSSLSSLGDITALERRNSKLQTRSSRVLSQDGIISPETDSGFVCSESSRLTLAAAPSPPQQRAMESVSVPQNGSPGNPQRRQAAASSSPSQIHTALDPRRGPRLSQDRPSRTRRGQRRRTFSSSPECSAPQTEPPGADSGASDFGLQSDSSHAVSEDRSPQYMGSISSLTSSSPGSSSAARHHHGDSLRGLSTSQVANQNDLIQMLQAEVSRLTERVESCMRNKKPQSSARAAPSAQENYTTHHNTSTPRIRSGEHCSEVNAGRERRTFDQVDESTLRRLSRDRPLSAPRPQPDNCSELSTPRPRPLVSRCTQTSHTRQHPAVSEAADKPDSRGHQASSFCLQHRRQCEIGGGRERTYSPCCHHCPLCGYHESCRSTEPDCCRVLDSPPHSHCNPVESPDRPARSSYCAAGVPPALLQYMPVCPQPHLLHPSLLYVTPSTSRASGGKGHRESRGRTKRFLSTDTQSPTDSSLNRAIRAAQHMKHTSGHMARSLATGLHYQKLLSQSCSY